ncbi:MAG: OmpA family protein [Bacteroidota bacterium]|nr:OmpA family protein [Candidatus Kapabacteria bacterium]MDW8220879.1 OmpA family protein [Bacteroidota bacterium]
MQAIYFTVQALGVVMLAPSLCCVCTVASLYRQQTAVGAEQRVYKSNTEKLAQSLQQEKTLSQRKESKPSAARTSVLRSSSATVPSVPVHVFQREIERADSAKRAAILSSVRQGAKVETPDDRLKLFIQNVDITRFPEVGLIVEATTSDSTAFASLEQQKLSVLENNKPRQVLSVKKISSEKRIPIDFVFVIDVTATMGDYISAVRANVETFTKNLLDKGIDFRLGLVTFSDSVEMVRQPTTDVQEFLWWLSGVQAKGGFDEKENALEALYTAMNLKFRPAANRVALLVTDAPYHQRGENGDGKTNFTTQSIIDSARTREMKIIPITKPVLKQYDKIAEATRATSFDITRPFGAILDTYIRTLANMYAITYRSEEPAIPDSINVAIVNERNLELVRRTIPILQIGRKLIIEDLLFATNQTVPVVTFQPQLERISEFMNSRKSVVIRVEGHTDAVGSAEYNLKLSLMRAEAVKAYLVQRQVAAHRIHTLGFGKSRPIAPNDTELGRRLNRRTEIVILEK